MPHTPREVRPYKKGCLRDDGGLKSSKKGLICWNGGIWGLPYRLPHDDPTAHFKLPRRTTFHPWCALDDWFRGWETADAAFGKMECGKPSADGPKWWAEMEDPTFGGIKLSRFCLRLCRGVSNTMRTKGAAQKCGQFFLEGFFWIKMNKVIHFSNCWCLSENRWCIQ